MEEENEHVSEEKIVLENRRGFLSNKSSIVVPQDSHIFCPRRQLDVRVVLEGLEPLSVGYPVAGLIDSGCTGSVIDDAYASACGFPKTPLSKPIRVHNADGSDNTGGLITHSVEL